MASSDGVSCSSCRIEDSKKTNGGGSARRRIRIGTARTAVRCRHPPGQRGCWRSTDSRLSSRCGSRASAALRSASTMVPRSRTTACSVIPRISRGFCSTMIADRPSSRTMPRDRAQQLLDDDRRQPLERLVEQQQPRVRAPAPAPRRASAARRPTTGCRCCRGAPRGAGTSRRPVPASTARDGPRRSGSPRR